MVQKIQFTNYVIQLKIIYVPIGRKHWIFEQKTNEWPFDKKELECI